MGSVLLVIHIFVGILLVALILMQRNSGNALSGLGGGNGADSFLSARGKGNLLTRTTAILATIFFITSILLALYYKGENRKTESITDVAPLVQTNPEVPNVPNATTEAEENTEANEAPAEVAPVEEVPATEETAPVAEENTEAALVEVAPATEETAPVEQVPAETSNEVAE